MNSELAEAFFRNIYETHTPSNWGDCSVCKDGSDMGYGVQYPCEFYKSAAEILGLPIVEWIKPPPKIRTPEEETQHKIFMSWYGPFVEMALRPPVFRDFDPTFSEGGTVTFRIQS